MRNALGSCMTSNNVQEFSFPENFECKMLSHFMPLNASRVDLHVIGTQYVPCQRRVLHNPRGSYR